MPTIKKPQKLQKAAKNKWKNILLYAAVALFAALFIYGAVIPHTPKSQAALSDIVTDIKNGKVEQVEVFSDKVVAQYKDKSTPEKTAEKEQATDFTSVLKNYNVDPGTVKIVVNNRANSAAWLNLIGGLFPILIMGLFFFFIVRQAKEAGQGIFSFSQSRAKLFNKDMPKVTFSDVAGVDEAKQELEEIVDFLKHPQKYAALGARAPKGVLLVGPAGTGKTLLARAVAGEANVPFFSVAGSEFMEMLVGVGASRVRDLFAQSKKSAPAIIFIDEIESIGRQRGVGFSGGHDEREQTLNQILVEMDGFTPNDTVVVIGATNRPDMLDAALVRPGRFDRRVVLDLPDIEGRKAIIKIHMKGKPFVEDVSIDRIAQRTVGFSGADIQNMLNEAAILAARHGKKQIDRVDLEEAATKVKFGPQRKRIITEDERKITAYHEGGHAIVNYYTPGSDPVHRISIVARGMSGGHTLMPPEVDRYNETKSRLIGRIATALGGRAAEELEFTDYTTGAASDLEVASNIAREMVTTYGMSDLGPLTITPQREFGMWAREGGSELSEKYASIVDEQVTRILNDCFETSKKVLREHRKELRAVSEALLDKETLERDEFEAIMRGESLPKTGTNGKTKKAEKEEKPKTNGRKPTVPTSS